MAGMKGRRHTNKEFKDNFVNLASNETIKGHLTKQKRSADDSQIVEGTLKYIIIDQVDQNGWVVEVGSGNDVSTYNCSNPNWATTMPEFTETDKKYVPKTTTRVEFSMDKQNKIYIIQRVVNATRTSLANYLNKLMISVDTNTKTNEEVNANVTMTKNQINLTADNITVSDNNNNEFNLIESQQEIQNLKNENELLKERLSNIEIKLQENEAQEEAEAETEIETSTEVETETGTEEE